MKRSAPLRRTSSLKRGAPFARSKPIARTSGLKRKAMRRRPARRIEERRHMRPYVALIHRMPCCCELGVYRFDGGQTADPSDYRESMCGGRIEANHAGEKPGMGLKASDSTCIPMCSLHHKDWSEHRGLFALWTREERRAWADSVIKECRLAAIPTLFDEALDLQDLGLGTIEGTADAWRWVPAGAEAAT